MTEHDVSGSGQSGTGATGRRRGRPRKWASDAERQAAYRARRALELADADGLRRELRDTLGSSRACRENEIALARELAKHREADGPRVGDRLPPRRAYVAASEVPLAQR